MSLNISKTGIFLLDIILPYYLENYSLNSIVIYYNIRHIYGYPGLN